MTSENIRVIIRFRPTNKREKKEQKKAKTKHRPIIFQNCDDKNIAAIEVHSKESKEPFRFTFDHILDENESQLSTFQHVAEQTCKDLINGYNGCIFAYGQTGSGKTYSMYGENESGSPELMGIIPRSCSYIFSEIEQSDEIIEAQIKVSFVEIYKENLRDLLNPIPSSKQLKIRMNKANETEIAHLTQTHVLSLFDVLKLIDIATNHRTIAKTEMNAVSSRSHMVLILSLQTKSKDGSVRIGKLNFCDLAGSEKVRKTNASGQRLKEAIKINLSLSVLGRVISALSENKHVPYRDSKLTHLLKDSLGGNCKTTLIVNGTKHMFNREETINSLRFGKRCKMITNHVKINKVYSNNELLAMLEKMREENKQLRKRTESVSMSMSMSAFDPMANNLFSKKNDELNEKYEKLQSQLSDLEREKEEIYTEFSQNVNELNEEIKTFKMSEKKMQNEIKNLQHSNDEYIKNETSLNEKLNEIRQERDRSLLEMQSLSIEYEQSIESMKKNQSYEKNEEMEKFEKYKKETINEKVELMKKINLLNDKQEKSDLIIQRQQNDLNEFEQKMNEQTTKMEQYEKTIKILKKQLDEMTFSKFNKLKQIQQESDEKIAKLMAENQGLRQRQSKLSKMGFANDSNTVSTEVVIQRINSVMIDEENEICDISEPITTQQSLNENVAYLQKLETERLNAKNIKAKQTKSPSSMNGKKRFFSFGKNANDLMMEKVEIENKIKEHQNELDKMIKIKLPKDDKERMAFLIEIGTKKDDIMALGRKLIDLNQKILKMNRKNAKKFQKHNGKSSVSADVAIYQKQIYDNNQPMIQMEKKCDKEMINKLKNGLEIKDRKHRLKTYHQCFVGRDAVSFMLENDICNTRKEAVSIGQMMIEQGVIAHVVDDKPFKDEKLFYQFVSNDSNSFLSPK